MTSERHDRLGEIFLAASKLPPNEQAAYLDEHCSGDADLRAEVEQMLRQDAATRDIVEDAMEGKGAEALAKGLADAGELPAVARHLPEFEPGDTIGPYTVIQRLGEGGFAVVYLTQQDEPVRRQVAVKVLKPGMDSRQILARFGAERQALAMMDHENVARIHDAGTLDNGRPYFVMEHVKGQPITHYCEANALSLKARLDLIVQACAAVQHAHQKGVIHRDIKPSNVLVADTDDGPVVKVIDFGVSKAINQPLTAETILTEHGQLVGTPEYMSPEQADIGATDIDTRTDVYSLGILLYELLVGAPPFDLRFAAYEEIRRTIRESEPRRPSTRIGTMGDGPASAATSAIATDPRTHARRLRGDLDWIVLKAMEKDRGRRYETADALAEDVKRHLADEPVLASPPSAVYRLRKMARKHRGPLAAAVIMVLLLIGGATGTTIGMLRALDAEAIARHEAEAAEAARLNADEQRVRAEAEADTAEFVSTFLADLFASPDPRQAQGETITALDMLDLGAERIDAEAGDQPVVQARLMETMGRAYFGLGEYEKARTFINSSLSIRREQFGSVHETVATSLGVLGLVQYETGDYEGAQKTVEEALAINRQLFGDQSAPVAQNLSDLAYLAYELTDFQEALDRQREVLELRRTLFGETHAKVAESLNAIASVLHELGNLEEAEEMHRQTLAMRREVLGENHPEVGYSLNNLSVALEAQGRYEEAEEVARQGLAHGLKVYGEGHAILGSNYVNLGRLLTRMGRLDEAESMLLESVKIDRATRGDDHPYVAYDLVQLGNLRREKGDMTGAEENLREALRIYGAALTPDDLTFALPMRSLAVVLLATDRAAEAEPLMIEALRLWRLTYPDGHRRIGGGLSTLGECQFKLGRHDDAEQTLLEGIDILTEGYGPDHVQTVGAIRTIIRVYEELSRPEDAARWAERLPPADDGS